MTQDVWDLIPDPKVKNKASYKEDAKRIAARAVPLAAGFPGDIVELSNLARSYAGRKIKGAMPENAVGYLPRNYPDTGIMGKVMDLIPRSEQLLGLLGKTGIDVAPPETVPGKIAEVGAAGGLFGLARGATRAAGRKAATTLGGKAADILKPVTAESLIGLGAGSGGQVAENYGYGPVGQMAGMLTGGVGATAGLSAATRAARGAQALLDPIRKTGAQRSAAGILQDAIARDNISPEQAVSLLGKKPALPGTVPEQLNSPQLNAILRSSQATSNVDLPGLATTSIGRSRAVTAAKADAIKAGVTGTADDISRLQMKAGAKVEDFKASMNRSIDNRLEAAIKSIEANKPKAGQESLSFEASKLIDDELRVTKAAEDSAWKKWRPVSKNIRIGDEGHAAISNIVKRITAEEKGLNIPGYEFPKDVMAVIKKIKPETNLDELQRIRSSLLDMQRNAKSGANPNSILYGKLNLLTRADDELPGMLNVMDDLGGDELKNVLNLSKAKNETFHKGPVGRLLQSEANGGNRVNPLATLDEVTSGKMQGGQNVDAARTAMGQQGDSLLEDYMRSRFIEESVVNGAADPKKAKAFLNKNNRILDRFPYLRNELDDAAAAAEESVRIAQNRARTVKSLSDKSMASRVYGADPDEVANGLKTATDYRKFLSQARGDESARRGAVRAISNKIINNSFVDDGTGLKSVNAKRMAKDMEVFGRAESYGTPILKPSEMSWLKTVLKSTRQANELNKLTGKTSILMDADQPFLTFLLRVQGARLGAAFGGKAIGAGQIQAAGAGARMLEKLANVFDQTKIAGVLDEAMFNPELAKALIMKPTSNNEIVIFKALRGYMTALDDPLTNKAQEQEKRQLTW